MVVDPKVSITLLCPLSTEFDSGQSTRYKQKLAFKRLSSLHTKEGAYDMFFISDSNFFNKIRNLNYNRNSLHV